MAVDARYRDKGGEISRKYGNTLIGTLLWGVKGHDADVT
jgi:hypothetical protein